MIDCRLTCGGLLKHFGTAHEAYEAIHQFAEAHPGRIPAVMPTLAGY